MAGMFYLPRLFIYHVKAANGSELSETLKVMERRLLRIIINPAMFLTFGFGLWLMIITQAWTGGWFHAKLAFVAALLAYHAFCYRLMGQLQNGNCSWSPKQLRALNELPTLLLVIVVMLVVFKNQFPTGAATWFIVALVVFMAASIQFYARWRRLRAEREAAAAA
jgi:putative membrane protein